PSACVSTETKLNQENTNKFSSYDHEFKSFINSDNNILEIFAIGGNGKSHLLKHFSTLESEYTPIVFTKQDNVEADLKNLDPTQKYLFIYDGYRPTKGFFFQQYLN
ncbi:hypothetical protein, partial [Aliarcobacter butzleri]|uniref:hypothetical protein n=1 Tax=Aliarcobacter butzleri TaxID=28197 RepID=UPI00062E710C